MCMYDIIHALERKRKREGVGERDRERETEERDNTFVHFCRAKELRRQQHYRDK